MQPADYTELLKQAEEELGKTPGAYCKWAVAIRAMELLQARGQQQFDELVSKDRKAYLETCEKQNGTIKRQAEAIKRLESEKTQRLAKSGLRGEIQCARDKWLNPEEPGIGISERFRRIEQQTQERRRMEAERSLFHKPYDPNHRLNRYMDEHGPGWQIIDK